MVYGVYSESEALEQAKSNAPIWMEYGDSIDSEYGTIRDVVDLETHNINAYTITPIMVGLK